MSNESKPIVKWRITAHGIGIARYEILRETEHFYIVRNEGYRKNGERREQKSGGVFAEWEDAKAALVARCQQTIEATQKRLTQAGYDLNRAVSLTKPEDK